MALMSLEIWLVDVNLSVLGWARSLMYKLCEN